MEVAKGASEKVLRTAEALVGTHGPDALLDTVKTHFKSTDKVLGALGLNRNDLGPEGQIVSKPYTRTRPSSSRS